MSEVTIVITEREATALRRLIGRTRPADFAVELYAIYEALREFTDNMPDLDRSSDWRCPSSVPHVE